MALYIPVDASRSVNSNDYEKVLVCNSSSPIVLTLLQDGLIGVNAQSSTTIALYQAGAGAVSFAAGTGVTLVGTFVAPGQYGFVGVVRTGQNTWAYL